MDFLKPRPRDKRRRDARRKQFLRGRIASLEEKNSLSLYTTIVNISDNGAKINMPFKCILPSKFLLEIRHADRLLPERHRCVLMWQKGVAAGVQFTPPSGSNLTHLMGYQLIND